MNVEHAEAAAKLAAEFRALEQAAEHIARGIAHDAVIRALIAEDAAESERSVHLQFTSQESAMIFEVAAIAVEARLAIVRKRLEEL